MGFFDRFKRKHEVAPSALPKAVKAEPVQTVKSEKDARASKAEAHKTAGAQPATSMSPAHGVLVRPIVSEKATRLSSLGQYVFMVAPHASKGAVKDAVRHRYGVTPAAVALQRYRGKVVRFGGGWGTTKGYKKAIVTLAKGESIDVLKESKERNA